MLLNFILGCQNWDRYIVPLFPELSDFLIHQASIMGV